MTKQTRKPTGKQARTWPPTGRRPQTAARTPPRHPRPSDRQGLPRGVKVALAGAVAVAVLFGVFLVANRDSPTAAQQEGGSDYPYAVGEPGPGQQAPPIRLPGTDGQTFDLAAQDGKTTMLYFQEGLMCQPCFDQITDIENNLPEYEALGIDQMVSITTDPLDALEQKVTDMGLATVVLSDPDLAVSRTYTTNQYGMMGDSRNGHSFIVVGPDGVIDWRADYGGAPEYTMFLPSASLLADLREGLAARQQ